MKILLCIVLLLVVLTLFAVWPGKRRDAMMARSAVPVATSSRRAGGSAFNRRNARSRQRRSMPNESIRLSRS